MTLTAQVKSHFLNLYNMVLADGTVKPEELMQIYQIGKRHGVSEEEFNQILLSPATFVLPETLELKVRYLYDLVEIILADQEVDADEIATLKHYIVRFGFERENVDEIATFLIDSVQAGKTIDKILLEINE